MMKKGLIGLTLYGVILIIAYINKEAIIGWLQNSDLSQLPIMYFLAILFGVIPIIPFSVFAGLMGAKYGVWIGASINWIGTIGAAAIFFLLARSFFVKQFQTYVTKYKGIKKFDSIISENAFLAVLFCRVIPIVPPPVVNIYSGISSMPFKVYFAATALGKIPGMFVYAYLGNHLFDSTKALIIGISVYIGFMLLIIIVYRWWYKSKSKIVLE